MSQTPLLGTATRPEITVTAPLLVGLAVALGVVAAGAALLWKAAIAAEARSHLDRGGRLRALDELIGAGSLRPQDYRERQLALLRET